MPFVKGFKHSEATKRKIRISRFRRKEKLGYINSPETRKKMSDANKGRISWNKGKRGIQIAWNKGKFGYKMPPCSEETKRKIGIGNKGKIRTLEARKKISEVRLGKKHSEETKRKMSLASIGKPKSDEQKRKQSERQKGEKSHWWKGGITPLRFKIYNSFYYKQWRKNVFIRDNWTCQSCKIKGGKIQAHHIKPFSQYPELRFKIDNGMTLCKKCHQLTDTYGGKISKIRNFAASELSCPTPDPGDYEFAYSDN